MVGQEPVRWPPYALATIPKGRMGIHVLSKWGSAAIEVAASAGPAGQGCSQAPRNGQHGEGEVRWKASIQK
jgi:hypothetical protein